MVGKKRYNGARAIGKTTQNADGGYLVIFDALPHSGDFAITTLGTLALAFARGWTFTFFIRFCNQGGDWLVFKGCIRNHEDILFLINDEVDIGAHVGEEATLWVFNVYLDYVGDDVGAHGGVEADFVHCADKLFVGHGINGVDDLLTRFD